MTSFDESLAKALEGIYVNKQGRTQIKDSHTNNGMTQRMKSVLDAL